jgi:hypothetical protein
MKQTIKGDFFSEKEKALFKNNATNEFKDGDLVSFEY